MPGALWRPSPNFRHGGVIRPARGVVLHTADGTFDGTIGWQHNPVSQVSSYFVVGQDGRIAQCVDTDDKAWTQGAGNDEWIGIENEGHGETGMPLTGPQLIANARIYAWLVQVYGIPLQSTDDPHGRGLGWHGMGAGIWETPGHPLCPGEVIKGQRGEILRQAALLLGDSSPTPKPKEDDMGMVVIQPGGTPAGRFKKYKLFADERAVLCSNGARLVGDSGPTSLGCWWHFKSNARPDSISLDPNGSGIVVTAEDDGTFETKFQ